MVDLNKIKSIKVTSDGTSGGTTLTTNQGDVIGTVVGLHYVVKSDEVAARIKLEVVLPALELEMPMDNVDLEIASIRHCPGCATELSPTVTSRIVETEGEEAKHEAIVVYECKDCNQKRVYPFTFDWESVPEDLSEYNDEEKEENNTEETEE